MNINYINDINFIKYLKYKNKYLKAKEQTGGALGTEPCPKVPKKTTDWVKELSVVDFLRQYDCTYKDIVKYIPEKLDKFNYLLLLEENARTPTKHQITIEDLISRGFSLPYLRGKGFLFGSLEKESCPIKTTAEMKELSIVGFLRKYNCVYNQIKSHIPEKLAVFDYRVLEEENAKIPEEHKITTGDLRLRNFPLYFLKNRNFPLQDLRKYEKDIYEIYENGYTIKELIDNEVTLREIKYDLFGRRGNYDVYQRIPNRDDFIKKDFSAVEKELVEAGCKIEDFIKHGYSLNRLKDLFTFKVIFATEIFKIRELRSYYPESSFSDVSDKEYTKRELEELMIPTQQKWGIGIEHIKGLNERRIKKINPMLLNEIGLGLVQLIELDYLPYELLALGYTLESFLHFYKLEDLKNYFTIQQLKDVKCSLSQILEIGYSVKELKENGINVQQLKEINYPLSKILEIGYSVEELKENGITLRLLKEKNIDIKIIIKLFSLEELIEFYNFDELKDYLSMFAFDKVITIAKKVKDKGFTAINLFFLYKQHQNIIKILLDNGYTLEELKDLKELKKNMKKYDYQRILQLFSLEELIKNFNFDELKDCLYSFHFDKVISIAKKVKDKGFTAINLYNLYKKYDENIIKILLENGYTFEEFKDIPDFLKIFRRLDFKPYNFKAVNIKAKELRKVGYTANELKLCGYTAKELVKGRYLLYELKEAGFNLLEMKQADCGPIILYQIGFNLDEIKRNFEIAEIVKLDNYIEEFNKLDNDALSEDDILQIIANIRRILDNLYTLNLLKNKNIHIRILLKAGFNIKDHLKYVYTLKDFVRSRIDNSIFIPYFPSNDLIDVGIDIHEIIAASSDPGASYDELESQFDALSSVHFKDKKRIINRKIIENTKNSSSLLDKLLLEYGINKIKKTLDYYFNRAPWITIVHPYYLKYKNLQDLINLRER